MKMRVRKKKNPRTRLMQADQSPACLQATSTLVGKTPLVFSEYGVMWCWNISLVSLGQLSQLCTLCTLPTSCSSLPLLTAGAEWETEKALMLCKHCWATAKTLVYYQHCFSHTTKTQHHMGS